MMRYKCVKDGQRFFMINLEFKNLLDFDLDFQLRTRNWRNSEEVSKYFILEHIEETQHIDEALGFLRRSLLTNEKELARVRAACQRAADIYDLVFKK